MFVKGKCIFIHINRTGGTSIENQLKKLGGKKLRKYKHNRVVDLLDIITTSLFDKYYSFSIVRNPWEKVVSLWSKKQVSNKHNMTLEDWVYNYCREKDKFTSNQLAWLTYDGSTDISKIAVKEIYQFSELKKAWSKICKKLNVYYSLPHLNKAARGRHYSTYYENQKLIDHIGNLYQADIDYFNYKFEKI